MNNYTLYIYLILVIKIAFILMSVSHVYMRVIGKINSDLDKNIVYWKERLEFVFVLLMAILLIYLFNPRKEGNIMINGETKILLYLFGFALLITANWGDFFQESKKFNILQNIIGKNE